jgi:hypothetical protein
MNGLAALLRAGLLPALLLVTATPVGAAESYDNCNRGFVASVPAILGSQGVYCLNKDLTGNLEDGIAITVTTNNVTLDCNGFKLGNQQAGFDNTAFGIQAFLKANITVRNCNIRGFGYAIFLVGSGHVVEDNRIEGSTIMGMQVSGDGSMIRRNFVLDTGTGVYSPSGAIVATGLVDIIDNTVTGVWGMDGSPSNVYGINLQPSIGGTIEGNSIRGLLVAGTGTGDPYGIFIDNSGGGVSVSRNRIANAGAVDGSGIQCAGAPQSMLTDNHLLGFTVGFAGCADVGLNYSQ